MATVPSLHNIQNEKPFVIVGYADINTAPDSLLDFIYYYSLQGVAGIVIIDDTYLNQQSETNNSALQPVMKKFYDLNPLFQTGEEGQLGARFPTDFRSIPYEYSYPGGAIPNTLKSIILTSIDGLPITTDNNLSVDTIQLWEPPSDPQYSDPYSRRLFMFNQLKQTPYFNDFLINNVPFQGLLLSQMVTSKKYSIFKNPAPQFDFVGAGNLVFNYEAAGLSGTVTNNTFGEFEYLGTTLPTGTGSGTALVLDITDPAINGNLWISFIDVGEYWSSQQKNGLLGALDIIRLRDLSEIRCVSKTYNGDFFLDSSIYFNLVSPGFPNLKTVESLQYKSNTTRLDRNSFKGSKPLGLNNWSPVRFDGTEHVVNEAGPRDANYEPASTKFANFCWPFRSFVAYSSILTPSIHNGSPITVVGSLPQSILTNLTSEYVGTILRVRYDPSAITGLQFSVGSEIELVHMTSPGGLTGLVYPGGYVVEDGSEGIVLIYVTLTGTPEGTTNNNSFSGNGWYFLSTKASLSRKGDIIGLHKVVTNGPGSAELFQPSVVRQSDETLLRICWDNEEEDSAEADSTQIAADVVGGTLNSLPIIELRRFVNFQTESADVTFSGTTAVVAEIQSLSLTSISNGSVVQFYPASTGTLPTGLVRNRPYVVSNYVGGGVEQPYPTFTPLYLGQEVSVNGEGLGIFKVSLYNSYQTSDWKDTAKIQDTTARLINDFPLDIDRTSGLNSGAILDLRGKSDPTNHPANSIVIPTLVLTASASNVFFNSIFKSGGEQRVLANPYYPSPEQFRNDYPDAVPSGESGTSYSTGASNGIINNVRIKSEDGNALYYGPSGPTGTDRNNVFLAFVETQTTISKGRVFFINLQTSPDQLYDLSLDASATTETSLTFIWGEREAGDNGVIVPEKLFFSLTENTTQDEITSTLTFGGLKGATSEYGTGNLEYENSSLTFSNLTGDSYTLRVRTIKTVEGVEKSSGDQTVTGTLAAGAITLIPPSEKLVQVDAVLPKALITFSTSENSQETSIELYRIKLNDLEIFDYSVIDVDFPTTPLQISEGGTTTTPVLITTFDETSEPPFANGDSLTYQDNIDQESETNYYGYFGILIHPNAAENILFSFPTRQFPTPNSAMLPLLLEGSLTVEKKSTDSSKVTISFPSVESSTWTNYGFPITGYRIYRASAQSSQILGRTLATPTLIHTITDLSVGTKTYEDNPLANGTTYYYGITTINSFYGQVQESAYSGILENTEAGFPNVLMSIPFLQLSGMSLAQRNDVIDITFPYYPNTQSWGADTNFPIEKYQVYKAPDSFDNYVDISNPDIVLVQEYAFDGSRNQEYVATDSSPGAGTNYYSVVVYYTYNDVIRYSVFGGKDANEQFQSIQLSEGGNL